MRPLKPKDIVAMTAEQLGLPEEDVNDAIYKYYSIIRNKLTKPESHIVNINGLGFFSLIRKTLIEKIEEHARYTKDMECLTSISQFKIKLRKRDDLERYVKLKQKLDEQYEQKQELKKLRNEQGF